MKNVRSIPSLALFLGALQSCTQLIDTPAVFKETAGSGGEDNPGTSSGGTSAKGGASSKKSATGGRSSGGASTGNTKGGASSANTGGSGGVTNVDGTTGIGGTTAVGSASATGGTTTSNGGSAAIGGTSSAVGGTTTLGGTSGSGGNATVADPVITSFTVDYNKVCSGNPATLHAVFANGTGTISGVSGTVTSGADVTTGGITANTTYTLTVTNSAGKTAQATVDVTALESGKFTATGAPSVPVSSWYPALLPNGKVLFRAADCSIQQYDLSMGAFATVGTRASCSGAATMAPLGNGKVLVTDATTAAIFDPNDGQFTLTASMSVGRFGAQVAYLPSVNRVLLEHIS
jgi:hypothetical protein